MAGKRAKANPAVREPVQAYLAADESDLLARLAEETGLSKAEILRRGIRAFAREQGGVSPMLGFLMSGDTAEWGESVAANHDEVLAESYKARPVQNRR